MVVRLSLGVLPINGRRGGRKEEFNPFAKDASQQHRRRRDERERQHPRRPAAPVDQPVAPKKDIKADLERKQREAIEKLEQKGDVVAPEVAPAPVPVARDLPGRTKTAPLFYPTRTGLLSCGENRKQPSKVLPELKPHPNSNPVRRKPSKPLQR